jgi:chromosomal replication initiation ATPase DnaA
MSGMRMVPIVAAKREIIWRMRQETLVNGRQISLLEIGQRMGLDHTTVLHHIRKYQAMHDGGLIAKR